MGMHSAFLFHQESEMNDTLNLAYKILYALENKGKTEYMGTLISPEKLGASELKWAEVMQSLIEEGYIAGVKISKDFDGNYSADITDARITLKGAEYLSENSTMKRIAKVATNVISFIK